MTGFYQLKRDEGCIVTPEVISDQIECTNNASLLFGKDERMIVALSYRAAHDGLQVNANKGTTYSICGNTNTQILLSEEEAITSFYYILKYITKSPTDITSNLGLFAQMFDNQVAKKLKAD